MHQMRFGLFGRLTWHLPLETLLGFVWGSKGHCMWVVLVKCLFELLLSGPGDILRWGRDTSRRSTNNLIRNHFRS